ncbi:MAG TPA: phosphatidylinositol-specific phospholipase C/glycerophosphodiester phosphodiesterase family protein [Pirellulales bacterium]|nr:phosphatidylinositol-specific phospholipase C/glycerophosphodiester phosphodiesterase family protein [Pirellulales bacterium]
MIAALVILAGRSAREACAESVQPLAQAHAHNDYLHERPLLDALDHGFASVEADIFLVDGKLLVAHTRRQIKPERTLEALYLEPLRQRVKANGGSVYPGGKPFHLLIDLKTAGGPTYAALAKVLASYADIVTSIQDGKVAQKPVDVSISGDRPIAVISAESLRYAGIDGRLSDLDSTLPAHLMPLVSDNWLLHFKWRGSGPISDAERKKLRDAVAKAHAAGRKIRLWATPDNVAMWRELRDAGVDMINTDDLAGLEKFLRGREPQRGAEKSADK